MVNVKMSIQKLRNRCSALPSTPKSVVDFYDVRDLGSGLDELENVLLCRKGVILRRSATHALRLCRRCDMSLRRNGRRYKKPPKFALANNLATGKLPASLADATRVEMHLVSLVTSSAKMVYLSGGAQKELRSHVILYDARPSIPVVQLPRVLTKDEQALMVILAGPFTAAQELAMKKMHGVRRSKVEDLLRFFQSNNALYKGVGTDEASLNSLPEDSMVERITYRLPSANDIVEAVNADFESHTRPKLGSATVSDDV